MTEKPINSGSGLDFSETMAQIHHDANNVGEFELPAAVEAANRLMEIANTTQKLAC